MCSSCTGKIGRHTAQEHERRRAKMRDPTGEEQEQRCVGQIGGFGMMVTVKISAVIDSHNNHHQTAQDVDGSDALFWSGFSKGCGFLVNWCGCGHNVVSLMANICKRSMANKAIAKKISLFYVFKLLFINNLATIGDGFACIGYTTGMGNIKLL